MHEGNPSDPAAGNDRHYDILSRVDKSFQGREISFRDTANSVTDNYGTSKGAPGQLPQRPKKKWLHGSPTKKPTKHSSSHRPSTTAAQQQQQQQHPSQPCCLETGQPTHQQQQAQHIFYYGDPRYSRGFGPVMTFPNSNWNGVTRSDYPRPYRAGGNTSHGGFKYKDKDPYDYRYAEGYIEHTSKYRPYIGDPERDHHRYRHHHG